MRWSRAKAAAMGEQVCASNDIWEKAVKNSA